MNLSLEPKKFINSEHTGFYKTITVPCQRKNGVAEMNIHYMDEGSGEPLLLIHSLGQSLYTWRSLFEPLTAHYRVIAVDLPGHGYSGKPASFSYAIPDMAHAISLILDALGIRSAHMLAYSMGCAYATELCRRYPTRVGNLILMSPGGITEFMPVTARMLQNPIFSFFAAMSISPKRVQDMLLECFLDRTIVTPEIVNEYFAPLTDPDARRALRLCACNYNEKDAISGLRDIEKPVLILCGSDDKWHSREHAELYHAAMRNANFALIRNAGHLLHEEKPEKILNAVRDFLPAPEKKDEKDAKAQAPASEEKAESQAPAEEPAPAVAAPAAATPETTAPANA